MIILLGSTGYIGSAFVAEMDRRGINYSCLHYPQTAKYITSKVIANCGTVINCAAFVTKPSVDACEDHKEECLLGNLAFPATVAAACECANVQLLHISTGCLYNGQQVETRPAFKETDVPMLTFDKGAGFYVGSKALAEQVVRQYEKTWICRVRLPFDQYDNPRNYITKLLTYPKIVDAYNSLAHRGDFVKACLDIIELKAPYGTYNMTNPGAIWAHDICKLLQDKGLLKRVNYWNWQEFMDTCARTTKSNAELDTSKLLATGVKMRTVREAIEDSINKFTTST